MLADRIFSLFEPSTEIIRKGKAGKPNEFGKMDKAAGGREPDSDRLRSLQSAPNDDDLLVPAIEIHQAVLGRTPQLAAADAVFYCSKNEKAATAKGVKRVCVPNGSTKSPARRREQKICYTGRDCRGVSDTGGKPMRTVPKFATR